MLSPHSLAFAVLKLSGEKMQCSAVAPGTET